MEMLLLAKRFWYEEDGAIVVSEITLVLTVLVVGLIVGLTTLRDSLVAELADTAAAIGSINQSYSFGGISVNDTLVIASVFLDNIDFCEADVPDAEFENCVGVIPFDLNNPAPQEGTDEPFTRPFPVN